MSETTASAKATDTEKPGNKSKRGAKKDINEPSFNMEEIRELADLVDEYGLTDFEFENENIRVRLSKTVAVQYQQQPAPAMVSSAGQTGPTTPAQRSEPDSIEASPSADEGLFKITSPIVGTFYRSPGPDKEAYVKEGSTVTPETVVCIVEAMKLMNEIQAETSGEVVKVYVENGQPVEYGQPLFGIRK
jgi:acetyl-CoA carboxylase biotin carboxyl carrier protein